MNRTDELTDRLIDGTLSDAEAVELEGLLAAGPGAQERHVALLRLELVLRGLRTEFPFAESTVAKIEADRVERTTAAVMSGLASEPAPVWKRRPWRRAGLWAVGAALAAAVVVAVWLGTRGPSPGPDNSGMVNAPPPALSEGLPVAPPPRPAPDRARVAAVSGSVEVVGPGGIGPAQPGQALAADQMLRTVGEESTAAVAFADGTRVEIHPATAVRFLPADGSAPRKVVLEHGQVTAVATGRLIAGTGALEVEATRGSFALYSSGAGSARVEPRGGDVRIVRGAPAEPVALAPGRAAVMLDDQPAVRIEAASKVQTIPRDRLNFHALDVGFAPGGEVVAVSAKQWARWKPGTPDPGRTPLLPKVSNDGVASWLTPDLRFVAVCRIDDREDRVSVRALPAGEEVGHLPVRVSEARFLCAGPDASWVATAGSPKPSNRRLRVWDVKTGTERFSRELDDAVSCLAASPDSRWLAVGVSDLGKDAENVVTVLDSKTGEKAVDLPTRRKGVYALAFSADGRFLAAGFNGVIQVWDVAGRKLVRSVQGFERLVTRLAFDPKGELLAAGTQDGQVWVWSTDTWHRRQVIETGTRGVRSVAFSPDAKQLVTATNKAGVAVWDVASEPLPEADPDA